MRRILVLMAVALVMAAMMVGYGAAIAIADNGHHIGRGEGGGRDINSCRAVIHEESGATPREQAFVCTPSKAHPPPS
jgi:hypothetical protein